MPKSRCVKEKAIGIEQRMPKSPGAAGTGLRGTEQAIVPSCLLRCRLHGNYVSPVSLLLTPALPPQRQIRISRLPSTGRSPRLLLKIL